MLGLIESQENWTLLLINLQKCWPSSNSQSKNKEQEIQNLAKAVEEKQKVILIYDHTVERLEQNSKKKQNALEIWKSTHAFAVLKLNDPNAKLPFYVIRSQNRTIRRNITHLTSKKHPLSEVFWIRQRIENPINMYKRLKMATVSYMGNYCRPECDEETFKAALDSFADI